MEAEEEPEPQEIINSSNGNITVLSEDALRQLSKSLTKIISNDVNGLENGVVAHIQSTLQDTLLTASSPNLSLTHGTAALNTLCGFLEQCNSSSNPQIRRLSYDTGTWTQAFQIYLTQSDSRPKPLRRLLLTLTSIISKHPVVAEKTRLLGISTCIATRAIRKQDDVANIKPAIQALDHFLTTGLIIAAEIAQIKWPEELGLFRTESMKTDGRTFDTHQEQINRSVQDFALSVLQWTKYPDCAPAVGRFLPVLFKTLDETQSDDGGRTSKDSATPLWISPVKKTLERHQELLEAFEIHILPNLLRLGPGDVEAFLKILPVESIRRGNIGSSDISDIRLCLLVAKTAEDPSLTKYFSQGQRIMFDLENLGTSLLEYSSSTVRLAALSLLVSSSASTRPYCRRVLLHLRRCIPYFHAEVNAKPRNEFIALMKKLCTRIRDATLSMLKRNQTPDNLTKKQLFTAAPCFAEIDDGKGSVSSNNAFKQVLNEESHTLEEHLAFRRWYIVFLLQELRPTATYQRHITALKALECLTEHTVALRKTFSSSRSRIDYFIALNEDLPRGLFLRPLTELLSDPFDDVRQSANRVYDNLLSLQKRRELDDKSDLMNDTDEDDLPRRANNKIYSDLTRAENRAGVTGRADHADGLGRLYSLLFTTSSAMANPTGWHESRYLILDHVISTLEREIDIARNDLLFAVSNMPLHSHLIALRYIVSRIDYVELFDASLNGWEGIDQRIISICSGVWDLVHDVLCSDAPEGYDFSEEDMLEQDIGTKDTLSFCWRALKESSLLMHAMVTNTGYITPILRMSTAYEGYHTFGHQAFTQLAELRHRGAFSTVSHTFSACCVKCARSSQGEFQGYPKTWYKLALNIIMDNASSLTRRSAGIPAIIIGVLGAYPVDEVFNDVIVDLQTMANAPVGADLGSLPQVHALNCLKDVFTDARFGPSTEIHIAHTLDIAASCLESHIWNIRNCGLMLFKALLKRLNGGTDILSTKASSSQRRFSQLTYEKYPNLPNLLLRLLRQTPALNSVTSKELHPTMQAHKVFPAFELIERSGIPSQQRGAFLDALRYYNESPDWSIREKAAKALSLIVDENSIAEEVRTLLAPNWKTQNALHGRLLRLRFLLARYEAPLFGELLNIYETIVRMVKDSLETLLIRNPCPITVATFLDILADLFAILVMSNSDQVENFAMLVLAKEQEIIAKCFALDLAKSPLRRCITLAGYVDALKSRPLRNANPNTLNHLSQADVDALHIVNLALQKMSDETDLAALRFCSARELRCAPDITQLPDSTIHVAAKNPRQSDYALALHGYALGERHASDTTNSEVKAWISLLSEAGAEHSDLRTRTASVFSIRAFFEGLLDRDFQLTSDPQLLGVYLALYDTLVDDDEDVRDQGASVVSTILSVTTSSAAEKGNTMSLSPPAAKKAWLHFIFEGHRSSMLLCEESLRRFTGMTSALDTASAQNSLDRYLHLRPVADLFLEARSTSNVVFVEERQNLYIDNISEAEEWTELLCRLDPDAWPLSLASELEAWTIEGLAHILEMFQNRIDGDLTSKPEVFTLITRILLAANVLIKRRGLNTSSKDKHTGEVCVELLEELLSLGRLRLLHDLLQYRIKMILGKVDG